MPPLPFAQAGFANIRHLPKALSISFAFFAFALEVNSGPKMPFLERVVFHRFDRIGGAEKVTCDLVAVPRNSWFPHGTNFDRGR